MGPQPTDLIVEAPHTFFDVGTLPIAVTSFQSIRSVFAWIAPDALRGELAEKWEMKQSPLRVEVQLRKGVMFPAKPGVMEQREFVADEVENLVDQDSVVEAACREIVDATQDRQWIAAHDHGSW